MVKKQDDLRVHFTYRFIYSSGLGMEFILHQLMVRKWVILGIYLLCLVMGSLGSLSNTTLIYRLEGIIYSSYCFHTSAINIALPTESIRSSMLWRRGGSSDSCTGRMRYIPTIAFIYLNHLESTF